MIGVTIRNGSVFNTICDEAVARFKYYTGIDKVVIFDTEKNPYLLKLRLHTYFQQTFVFFDADLWFVNKCNLSQYEDTESIVAVKDIGRNNDVDFPKSDCYWHGINSDNYINTGFFIANGRSQLHKDTMEMAWLLKDKIKVDDFGEQSLLNIAIQRLNTPLKAISHKYNYAILCDEHNAENREHVFEEHPYAIHALGFKGEEKLFN